MPRVRLEGLKNFTQHVSIARRYRLWVRNRALCRATDRFVPILLKKSFWNDARKFLELLMRSARDDVRGPYRFIQNQSRTSVVALTSDAAAETRRDRLSQDFSSRSIFDFCNNICRERKLRYPTVYVLVRLDPNVG
jgi:hypothetical protein